MRLFPFILVCLTVVVNGGCVMVTNYAKLEPQLEQWEKDNEYGRTLDALGQIDPKDPDYSEAASRRKQVEKKASEYEQRVRKETSQKLQRGEWAAALDQYDKALAKYPQSVVIKDGLAKLHQQQRENLEELEIQRLIKHGEWMQEVLPIYQEIANVDPRNSDAQNRLRRITGEAHDIARELAISGNKALADNDLDSAEQTLPLAFSLHNDPVIEESLKRLHARQKKESAKQREARRQREQQARSAKQQRDRTISSLLKRYNTSFAKQDFDTARKQLHELERVDHSYSKLPAMKRDLQKAIDDKVEKLFSAGVSAYSRGQFEQAARNWRSVLQLDPNHLQARESLDRAEKVLKNIERLKEKQGE